ncbi:MAG: hypothetical protein ACM3U2_04300 [Deltaproteobacteria bacterium]
MPGTSRVECRPAAFDAVCTNCAGKCTHGITLAGISRGAAV